MNRIALLSAPFLLGLALPSLAQPACNADGSQLEMNQCAFDDLGQADAELNAAYGQILRSVKNQPVAVERLKAAQRLWIQLRDADLAAQFPLAEGQSAQVEYGSIYLLEYAIAGQDPTVANAAAGSLSGTTLSYSKRPGTSGLTYAIEDSTDLGVGDPWQEVPAGPAYVNDGTTISYTMPAGPARNFIRLRVSN